MSTPNRNSETKQSWHKPQAYILRGSQAGSGTPTPGALETQKTEGFLEETLWIEKGSAVQPS